MPTDRINDSGRGANEAPETPGGMAGGNVDRIGTADVGHVEDDLRPIRLVFCDA